MMMWMPSGWHRLTISAIALSVVFLWIVYRQPVSATAIPDNAEAYEIRATVQKAYAAISLAYETGNFVPLSAVVIDHPDFWDNLDTERQNSVRYYLTKLWRQPISGQGGYLTAMKAKITQRLAGEKLLKAALAKAAAEKRGLTTAEWQTLTEQNHGVAPSLPNPNLPSTRTIREWKSIEIDGDKARAVYDIGVVDRTAILVKIDGHWYVAGIF